MTSIDTAAGTMVQSFVDPVRRYWRLSEAGDVGTIESQEDPLVSPLLVDLPERTQASTEVRRDACAQTGETDRQLDRLVSLYYAVGNEGIDIRNEIERIIIERKIDSVLAIHSRLVKGQIVEELGSEILRFVGYSADLETREVRRWLLEKAMSLPSFVIRDGALLGIEAMDDARSAVALRAAIQKECVTPLRRDMIEVLAHLGE
jgi:hypothetical protein